MSIAALITEGVGPGGSVKYLLTGGLDLGAAPPPVPPASVQVLNYGVMRRRREEYEAQRREEEQIAHDLAAAIDEGLPEPLRPVDEPARTPPGAEALEAASLALSRAAAALATDEAAAARIAAAVEAKVRGAAALRLVEQRAVIAAALDDYDDDDEAILALLLAS